MTLYSTIWCDQKPGFPPDVNVINRSALGRRRAFDAIRRVQDGDAVLLNGALGARQYLIDLLFGIFLRFFRRNVTLLISDATWHPRTVAQESGARVLFKLYGWVQKRLLLLCDSPHTHFCFLSRNEVATFQAETGIDGARVHFTPFASQLPLEILDELHRLCAEKPEKDMVFAGGNSLRDYDTLISAARGMDAQFVIASSNRHVFDPLQITFAYLGHLDFFRTMARSSLVVVPLVPTDGRSVGQQTYLNAMALGKPVIVSDVSGVHDHLVAGDEAMVVPPRDAAALRDALRWALSPANAESVANMARKGRTLAEQRTFAHYCAELSVLLKRVKDHANEHRADTVQHGLDEPSRHARPES